MSIPFRIELERTEYSAGDTIRGVVHVEEDVDRGETLTVAVEYYGRRISVRRAAEVTLHQGALTPGRAFAFELVLPYDAPFSFAGHAHDARWRVRASAKVPFAFDPAVDRAITVAPRVIDGSPASIATVTNVTVKPEPERSTAVKVIVAVLVLAVVVALLPLLPIALILLVRQRMIHTRLKDFTVTVPERHFALGEWVPVVVRFHLKRPVDIERLALTFRGTEQWTTSTGKTTTTHYHHFHQVESVALTDTVLAPWPSDSASVGGRGVYRSAGVTRGGEPEFEWRTAVRLPAGGLPSAGAAVYYKVSATMKLRGWPDPTAESKIKTVSAQLAGEPQPPEAVGVNESSAGLAFVRKGEAPPSGVSVETQGAGAVWAALAAVTLGVTLAGFGVSIGSRTTAGESFAAMGVGVLLLVAGGFGTWRELSG